MNHDHAEHNHPPGNRTFIWVLWGLTGVAAVFLFAGHRAHLFGALPFLLLLACPLMHLFHRHGGHGSHHRPVDGGHEAPDPRDANRDVKQP